MTTAHGLNPVREALSGNFTGKRLYLRKRGGRGGHFLSSPIIRKDNI
jgi:hypothetical protein